MGLFILCGTRTVSFPAPRENIPCHRSHLFFQPMHSLPFLPLVCVQGILASRWSRCSLRLSHPIRLLTQRSQRYEAILVPLIQWKGPTKEPPASFQSIPPRGEASRHSLRWYHTVPLLMIPFLSLCVSKPINLAASLSLQIWFYLCSLSLSSSLLVFNLDCCRFIVHPWIINPITARESVAIFYSLQSTFLSRLQQQRED